MIPNLFSPNGFYWFVGVVENRNDPLMAGRCQVRIVGDHTANKEILPTKDLPWAIPMMPITSASISGKGSAPLGPLEGSWVVGFYLDGPDKQMPLMIGTICSTVLSAPKYQKVSAMDKVANPVADMIEKQAEAIEEGTAPSDTQITFPPKPAGWELGKTSEKFESGGRGPGVINDYNGKASDDFGGASYGIYQLASFLPPIMPNGKQRKSAQNSPLVQYIRNSRFKYRLQQYRPATPEFDGEWKAIANEHPAEFREDQHAHIKKSYYDVMMTNLKRAGLDLSSYGPSVQDLVWSTAVQLGPGATEVFLTPLKGKAQLSDLDIVNLVSDYKLSKVDSLFRSSNQNIKDGVSRRYASEKTALLKLNDTAVA